MVEVLVALVLALILVFVFHAAWALNLSAVGGVGFVLYALVLVVRWLVDYVRRPRPA